MQPAPDGFRLRKGEKMRRVYSSLTVAEYLSRYYIGHYNPSGNFFFANAVRGLLVDWLDPKPLPYLADIDRAAELSAMSKL